MTLISLRNSAQITSRGATISIEEFNPGVVVAYAEIYLPTIVIKRRARGIPAVDLIQFDSEARLEAWLCDKCGDPEIEILAQFIPSDSRLLERS